MSAHKPYTPRDAQERAAVVELVAHVRRTVRSYDKTGRGLLQSDEDFAQQIVPKVPPKLRVVPIPNDIHKRSIGIQPESLQHKSVRFNIYLADMYCEGGPPRSSHGSPYTFQRLLDTAATEDERYALAAIACDLHAQPYEPDEPAPIASPALRELSDDDVRALFLMDGISSVATDDNVRELVRTADRMRGVTAAGAPVVYGYATKDYNGDFSGTYTARKYGGQAAALNYAQEWASAVHGRTVHVLLDGGAITSGPARATGEAVVDASGFVPLTLGRTVRLHEMDQGEPSFIVADLQGNNGSKPMPFCTVLYQFAPFGETVSIARKLLALCATGSGA